VREADAGAMPTYKVYTFNSKRHITAMNEIDCATDEDAATGAKQFLDGHDLEVWERGRFITALKADR
jgi:hypothetical protein